MAEAQVVLALGVDWDFRTGYGENLAADAVVIQIDGDAAKVGWNRAAHVGVVADPMTVVTQLVDRTEEIRRVDTPVWTKEIMDAEAAKAEEAMQAAADDSSPVMPQRFAKEVSEFFGPDSIVSVDGGDIVSTTARWLQTSTPGHVLDPGPFGTLGTGAPYAIAAKTVFPDKTVGIVFGDGGFGFNGMEYDTMVRLGLPIIGVVGNDGVWSNIKTFHRMAYPERLVATDLGVRPYHEMVKGLGGYGEFVSDPNLIRPALERARESGLPSLINVHLAETMRMSSNYSQ
jgi:acetolactate synthase-1/2/3 large subunit